MTNKIPFELTQNISIQSLSHEGRGIAKVAGKTVFVEGALPGEQVNIDFIRQKNRFSEARISQILVPHPDRVEPPCKHFDVCGGCSLQHLGQEAQLAHKQKMLEEQLLHFGKVRPKAGFLEPVVSDGQSYRRKARLGCKFVIKKDKLLLGFREKHSSFLADIEHCYVLDDRIDSILPDLRKLIETFSNKLMIPQIEVACGEDACALVVRCLEPLIPSDQQNLTHFCQQHNIHLYLQPGGLASVHRVWPAEGPERLCYTLPDHGIRLFFHPMDFVQVNAPVNRAMISKALELLQVSPDESVLDLFCGLGNFTMPLALNAKNVVGVEGASEMVSRGMENAAYNGLHNIQMFVADLAKSCVDESWVRPYDKVLLDPPRSGAEMMISVVGHKIKPKRLVYVSCNPATLARDARLLADVGYQLQTAGILDMFPHTTHVETIALFLPKG